MIELLLYSNLTCAQANAIINRAEKLNLRHGLTPSDLQELVTVVKESTPECFNEGPK
mgnify:CR=1 FL=1|jgi:hypothetical protein